MTRRAAFSSVSLILLLVFLLGLTLKKLDEAHHDLRSLSIELTESRESIVNKLVEFFTPILQQEHDALLQGKTPPTRIETIITQLKGIDPALIQEAVDKAMKEVARKETTTTSTSRPPSVSSTTTTTTTPQPPTTDPPISTSSSTTTTTTRPCALNLGLVKLCLQ